jgi:hypothetical protein
MIFGANLSGGTELGVNLGMLQALKSMAAADGTDSLPARNARSLTSSIFELAGQSTGLGGQGARHFSAAAAESTALKQTLSRLDVDGLEGGQEAHHLVTMAMRAFSAGLGQVALVNLPAQFAVSSGDAFFFDTHSAQFASLQPEGYGLAAQALARVFKLLRETPFDAGLGLSFLDVTTVVVTSEFGRTNRQLGTAIDQTGTDHNRFGNMALVGGKGIEPGLFVGSTDLDALVTSAEGSTSFTAPSLAHQRLDPSSLMAMGHVYDFAAGRPDTSARPEIYRMGDYLTVGSLANTIYRLFDVPEAAWRAQQGLGGAQGARFPVIREILKPS